MHVYAYLVFASTYRIRILSFSSVELWQVLVIKHESGLSFNRDRHSCYPRCGNPILAIVDSTRKPFSQPNMFAIYILILTNQESGCQSLQALVACTAEYRPTRLGLAHPDRQYCWQLYPVVPVEAAGDHCRSGVWTRPAAPIAGLPFAS